MHLIPSAAECAPYNATLVYFDVTAARLAAAHSGNSYLRWFHSYFAIEIFHYDVPLGATHSYECNELCTETWECVACTRSVTQVVWCECASASCTWLQAGVGRVLGAGVAAADTSRR